MSSDPDEPPPCASASDQRVAVTYVLNPTAKMSSGKTVAQVAHTAVIAGGLEDWVADGCPGRVVAPSAGAFEAIAALDEVVVARVVDAGLTEVPPGTVTVVALRPAAGAQLPEPIASSPEGREPM